MSRLLVQPRLTLRPGGDRYEQEADRVAQQVVEHGQSQRVQPLHGAAGATVDPEMQQAIRQAQGGGQPLPETVRTGMEQAFGADFSGVRVHTGSAADGLNRALTARAFTTGQAIFFRQGEYDPVSISGQHTLAHELTHVIQQTGSNGRGPTPAATVQRQLSVNAPIDPTTIVSVTRVSPDKLVFIVTDNHNSTLVIKAEQKVSTETVGEMGARFEIGQYAAEQVLGRRRTPAMRLLDRGEVNALVALLPNVGDAAALLQVLGQPDLIVYKAEKADVGQSLMERGAFTRTTSYTREGVRGLVLATTAEVTQEPRGFLRSERVWEDWGKTALLDLLTDNNDRFPFSAPLEEAAPNFENLDLTPGGMPLAFDNLDKAAFMTKATWRCAGSVKDAKKYCSFFARNICERWRVGGDLAQQAEAAFWRGFLEGRTAMQSEATLDYLKGQAEAYDAIRRGVVKEFIRRIRKLSDVKT